MRDWRPIVRLSSPEPEEMRTIVGSVARDPFSQLLTSATICWQKPHAGFQNRIKEAAPRKSDRQAGRGFLDSVLESGVRLLPANGRGCQELGKRVARHASHDRSHFLRLRR